MQHEDRGQLETYKAVTVMTRCRHYRDSQAPSVPGQRSGERMASITCDVDAFVPTECVGTKKALDRIYKMVGEGVFCFLGKSILF